MVSFVFVTLYSLLPAGRWLLLGEQDPPRLHFISHTEVEGGPTKLLLVVQDGVAVSVGITLKSISFFFVSIANKRIGGGGVFVFTFNLSLMFKCCQSEIPVLNEILKTQPYQFFLTLRESVHEVHFTTSHKFSIPYARLCHSG